LSGRRKLAGLGVVVVAVVVVLGVDVGGGGAAVVAVLVCGRGLLLLESEDRAARDDDGSGMGVERAAVDGGGNDSDGDDVFAGPAAVVLAEDRVVVVGVVVELPFRKGLDELATGEDGVGVLVEEEALREAIGSEVGVRDGRTAVPEMAVDEFREVDKVSTGSLVGDDSGEAAEPEEGMEVVVAGGIRDGGLDFPSGPVAVGAIAVEFVHRGEEYDDETGRPPVGTTATLALTETDVDDGTAVLLVPGRDELDGKAAVLEDAGNERPAGRLVSLAPTDLVDDELLR
jgi:hypothetical protein